MACGSRTIMVSARAPFPCEWTLTTRDGRVVHRQTLYAVGPHTAGVDVVTTFEGALERASFEGLPLACEVRDAYGYRAAHYHMTCDEEA